MFIHIDLFSGIGGFTIAAGWAGFRTIVFCEIDEFCQEVLKAKFGAVADSERHGFRVSGTIQRPKALCGIHKKAEDPKKRLSKSSAHGIDDGPLLIPDIRDFDGSRFRGATLLTGGFPCQPVSCAGKRRGKADDRWLWPEMLRVIKEARPAWVLGENVAGIVSMELEQVCIDLEGEGYEVQPIIIPACAVNAPHRRDRVWIVAHNSKDFIISRNRRGSDRDSSRLRRALQTPRSDSNAPDTATKGLSGICQGQFKKPLFHAQRRSWEIPWPEIATRLCRMDDGLPAWIHVRRVARLKALGNSIVPQVACQIIQKIAEIENANV